MKAIHFCIPLLTLLWTASVGWAGAPKGFVEGRNQEVSPQHRKGVVSFTLKRGDCQKRPYGDGRGESDCKNGNSRSQINSKSKQRMGRAYEYSMQFRIVPGFRYDGRGWGKVNHRSRLLLAEWQRVNTIKNHMYEMHLDSRRGVTFEDKTCVPPARFGEWNTFTLKVKWSNKADGFLQAACNGKVIYQIKGPNAVPPGCGKDYKLQCKPELQDLRQPIQWQLGPHLRGHGMGYARFGFPSPFPPFPKNGLRVDMRDIYYGKIRR